MGVRETDRDRDRKRQTDRDRETDTETERERQIQRQIHRPRETEREREMETDRDRDPTLASLCIAHLEYCAIARVIFNNYTGAGHMVQRETNGVLTRVNLGPPVKVAS